MRKVVRGHAEEKGLVDQAARIYKEMHKGAHPSSILLGQTVGDEPGNYVIGAHYKPAFCVRALDRGIFATYLLLGEFVQTETVSNEWLEEYWTIFNTHQEHIQAQLDTEAKAALHSDEKEQQESL